MRYALVDASGLVQNVIEWDGNTEHWAPPSGLTAYQSDLASVGYTRQGDGTFLPPPPPPAPPPTAASVIIERQRRLSLGFDYDFEDGRGVHHIGTSNQDMQGWDEVSKASQAAIALGFPSTPLTIVTETGSVTVTALEWQQILLAASQARQPIWAASFALQAMTPIPDDYTSDTYWSA